MVRQVMETAGLTLFPMISLILFFLLSLSVVLWTWRKGSKNFYQSFSEIALTDEEVLENSK
jgi:cbb3-type cytochrome oxidase subunit 3